MKETVVDDKEEFNLLGELGEDELHLESYYDLENLPEADPSALVTPKSSPDVIRDHSLPANTQDKPLPGSLRAGRPRMTPPVKLKKIDQSSPRLSLDKEPGSAERRKSLQASPADAGKEIRITEEEEPDQEEALMR